MNRLRIFILTVWLVVPSILPGLLSLAHPASLQRAARTGYHLLQDRARALFGAGAVLLYHRVLPDPGEDCFRLAVQADRFAAHMQWLQRNADVMSLDSLAEQLREGRIRGRPVAITFDDGYRDNRLYAAEILRSYGLPATFYLTAGYIGRSRAFWWDDVAARLRTAQPDVDPHAVHAACRVLRELPTAEREPLLAAIGAPAAPPPYLDQPMSWEQAGELARMGFTIGAHSLTHPALGRLRESEIRKEVVESRRLLQARLGVPVRHFCYPYDEEMRWRRRVSGLQTRIVAEAGYQTATTVVRGGINGGTSPLVIPRLAVQDWDVDRFATELTPYLSRRVI